MIVALRKMIEKLQVRIVFNFPLTRLLLAKAARSGIQYNLPMYLGIAFLGIILLPVAVVNSIFNRLCDKFVIGQIAIIITTLCNLKCKHCVAMTPLYEHPSNREVQSVLDDIEKLLEVVDYIYAFQIVGGEPFLHKDIAIIINKLLSSKKIATINIVTNGAIIPGQEALAAMKDKRVNVQISGYPENLVPNISKLMGLLDHNNINYGYSKNQKWKYLGDKSYKHRNVIQKKEVFDLCAFTLCNHMIDGKYHICTFAGNGMSIGVIPQNSDDYVDIRELPAMETRKKLKQMLSKRYNTACDYCDGNTFLTKTIPAAEQAEKHDGISFG